MKPIPEALQQLLMVGNLMAAHLNQLGERSPEPDPVETTRASIWESRMRRYIEESRS